MVSLILGMLVCVALALVVVALVAVPARRDGRGILTPKGEEVVSALKERQQSARDRLDRGSGDAGDAADDREHTDAASTDASADGAADGAATLPAGSADSTARA